MEPQIRFCTSADGTRIAYATVGEGPPLLQVSGWGGHMEVWWRHPEGHAYLESLSLRRLYVDFDLRGVGASQREVSDFSLDAQVADVAAVADHLQLERFDLFGGVEGAAIAIAFAAQHPERVSRLVLWGSYPWGKQLVKPEAIRSLLALVRQNWVLARRAMAAVVYPSGPTELQKWYTDSLRQSISPEVAATCLEFQFTVDVRGYLPQVKAPTLVLHRRGDRNAPISAGRAVAALIPDARFVTVEGDSADWFTAHEQHLQLILDFLDEGRVPGPSAESPEPGAVHTILFTDMEGSTALTQRLGDAKAQELLRAHNAIVREALREHSGSEIKHTGDGIMASFPSTSNALHCAIAIQKAVEGHSVGAHGPFDSAQGKRAPLLKVHIGLNAGEPVAEEQDLFGTAVQLARRICDQAEGGEILASDVVRQLAAGKGFLFSDRGDVTLRGFEDPTRLYELRWRER